MAKTEPFNQLAEKYDRWFEENEYIYQSEIKAIRTVLPRFERGVEIGVGTGRFAIPLGLKFGVEPSCEMRKIAMSKGLEVIDGVAEALPFLAESFDLVLMVTTVCFLDDIQRAFKEVHRILKPSGAFIVALVDRKSPIGSLYLRIKDQDPFYRLATFYSTEEILSHLQKAGFSNFCVVQTLFRGIEEIDSVEPVKEGYGEGSFVVIKAIRGQNLRSL
ncbi:MAG: methyltransferase domain-containing protein [Thermotogae bacterium]|nr:methyltransferase domain-containing protein [Thermotogota bacterium]